MQDKGELHQRPQNTKASTRALQRQVAQKDQVCERFLKYKQTRVHVPQGKLRLLVLKNKLNSSIANHKGKNHHSGIVKEVLLVVHEIRKCPLCEDLCTVPSEHILLPKASQPFATVSYPAAAMA